ncbi:MAG: hypothetical protein H7Z40_05105 [Phycisphaerae bacterium]|nr:hypothetical protein [Gemmatimonadaceae bacterium]
MRKTFSIYSLAAACVAALPFATTPVNIHAQVPAASFEGRPAFKEGKALGYFVWHEGDTWKLRWMTFDAEHNFTGRVVVVGGEIASFKRIDLDTEREVLRPARGGSVVRGPRGRVVAARPGRAAVVTEKTIDKIQQANESTIEWQTKTDDDLDGLDFKVTAPASRLRFVLLIDGKAQSHEVEVGRTNIKPGTSPLVVQLKP